MDYDNIVDSILSMLDGDARATIGICSRSVQTSKYVHYLQDVWQALAAEFADVEDKDAFAEEESIAEEEMDTEDALPS